MSKSVAEIQELCRKATGKDAAKLHGLYGTDARAGVQRALDSMSRRLEREAAEMERVRGLYAFEQELRDERGAAISVGLDEVGRGPLAGPLAIGAVVLDLQEEPIWGIDDSKKLSASKRTKLAREIERRALAWDVVFVSAKEIDEIGISSALRRAFTEGIAAVERQLAASGHAGELGCVVLDGNAMGLDEREANVVKGDAKVASVAAASIIAKARRDAHMEELDAIYPEYGFAGHKGYGAASHIEAIREHGLTDEHRASFCKSVT